MSVRRGTQLVSGALVAVLVGVVSLLVSGGARGVDAEHCARLEAQSQLRQHEITGHGARVAVIGDSYSVGYRLADPEASWPSRLPGRVQVFGFSGSGFSAHASACGPAASYAARAPEAVRSGADQIVVEGGLNDYDQPSSAIRTGFRALMAELRGKDVLVVGPADAPSRADGARRVDAVLREESRRAGVRYLSMLDVPLPYLDDRLHPTVAGHGVFGSVVAAALTS